MFFNAFDNRISLIRKLENTPRRAFLFILALWCKIIVLPEKKTEGKIWIIRYDGANAVKSEWADVEVGSADVIVSVKVSLPEEAGNEYKGKSCKFAYTVEAVQGNAEVTSEWDGHTTTAITKNTEDGKYHITTAAELVWLMENTQDANSPYIYETIVLDNNIDLGGNIVKGLGSEQCNFAGSFDGQKHTIKNFVIERSDKDNYAGLFNYVTYGTISNLNVANATINGDQSQVGALVGGLCGDATVKNCSVENCTVVANRKVGGAVGYVEGGSTVENVSVKDTTIYVGSTDATQYGKVVGFANTGAVVNSISDENVTIVTGVTAVSTIEELKNALQNGSGSVGVLLMKDITVGDDFTPISFGFYGTYTRVTSLAIYGNGHTISGLKSALVNKISANCSVKISNLTVKGASISNSSYTNGMGNGILVGYVENGSVTLDNCHVADSEISESGVAAAALIGYMSGGTEIKITNCTVKNTDVNGDNAAGFIGYVQQSNIIVSGCQVSGGSFTGAAANKQGAFFGTVNVSTVANISNTTADTTDLVGRILSTGVVNYN